METLDLEGKRMSYKVDGTTCIVEHYHRFAFPMHFCDLYEYLLCRGGSCRVILQGQEMVIGPGQALMIFPGQIHGVRLESGELFLLTFSSNLVPEFEREIRDKSFNNRRVFDSSGWFDSSRIDALTEPRDKVSLVFLQTVAMMACSDFLEKCELNRVKKKNDIYSKALQYIQKHYRQEISLAKVAKAINANKDYLCRLMKQSGGIGFLEYVNQLRLNYAVTMMQQNPDIKLSEVAVESGFGTMRAFDMVFSQYYGAPPKKYRQTAKAPFSGTHWENSEKEKTIVDLGGKKKLKKIKLKVTMRDGKGLVTFIYLPVDDNERAAAIFLRNPYVEDTEEQEKRNEAMVRSFVDAGFAVVLQHCRGRGGSEGDFIPFVGEREDGLDTIAWIERQNWFDGRLYLWGGSYLTYVHLSYMDSLPACVKGACLAVMPPDCQKAFYTNGAFKADVLPSWYTSLYHPEDHPGKDGNACRREFFDALPFSEFGLRTYGYDPKPLNDLIVGSAKGEYGAPGSFSDAADAFKNLKIPVQITDGWGEMFFTGMQKMWQDLPEETRKRSAFVLGPWTHAIGTSLPDWKYDFGDGAGDICGDLEWFLWLRDGKPLNRTVLGKVNYFHIGKNIWETADDLIRLPQSDVLYLGADGTLAAEKPAAGAVSYTFDPMDPPSFPGGPNTFCSAPQGFAPQPEPNFRPDVKSFLTVPLDAELTLAGKIGIELDAVTDCEATMFVARVCCVEANGVATVMQDAVSVVERVPEPGKPMHLSFETDTLCWTLRAGERLRVDIASADAHSYRVHPNTAGDWFTQREARVAHQTLCIGESCLKLPVDR